MATDPPQPRTRAALVVAIKEFRDRLDRDKNDTVRYQKKWQGIWVAIAVASLACAIAVAAVNVFAEDADLAAGLVGLVTALGTFGTSLTVRQMSNYHAQRGSTLQSVYEQTVVIEQGTSNDNVDEGFHALSVQIDRLDLLKKLPG